MHIISVWAIPIFISEFKHVLENQSNAYWRSLLFELNNARSSATTAGVKHYTPKCDATTEGTVSVYLVYAYNEQKRKNTALL